MNDFLLRVKDTVSLHNLLQKGDRVLVALSGGADSVCLLEVLSALSDEFGLSLSAAHLHHGLRGDEADGDAAFAEELCKKKKIPFFMHRADVRALANESGMSLEEAGRKARYDFFHKLQKEYGFTKIATAHHAGDNVETVLMRLLRGTGPMGLGGVPYQNESVIRPLLDVTRDEIEVYLNENGLPFRTDSTNLEQSFTRNKIRHSLVPFLEKEFNPNFRRNFQEQIRLYARCGAYIKEETEALFSRLAQPISNGFGFDCQKLKLEPSFLTESMLYLCMTKVFPGKDVTNSHVQTVANMLREGKGQISLPDDTLAEICHNTLYIHKIEKPVSFCYEILPNGEVYIPEIGKRLSCYPVSEVPKKVLKHEVYLDAEKLSGKKLFIRSRKDGDYFYLSESGGTKKLQDFFVDQKVPRFLRDSVPLIATEDEILWIGGYRAGGRYMAGEGQRQALCFTIHKEERA